MAATVVPSPGVAVQSRTRARRRAWLMLVGALACFLPAILWGAGSWFQLAWWLAMATLGVVGNYVRLARPPQASELAAGSVSVEGERLVAVAGDRRHELALSDVQDGWLDSVGARRVAAVRTRRDVVFVELDDDAARELLRACGVAPEQRVFRMRLSAPGLGEPGVRARMVVVALGCLLASVALVTMTPGSPRRFAGPEWTQLILPSTMLAFALGIGAFVIRALLGPTLRVGADGLSLERPLGGRRLVRYRSVRDVIAASDGVHVHLDDGPPLVLRPWRHGTYASGDTGETKALAQRIGEAMALGGAGASAAATELLDRRGRSWSEWREALARLAHDEGDYRNARLAPDDLARVVEDVAATPERRVAAALALRALGDDALVRRARVASAACADPRLRVAIERAAEGQLAEAELEAALAEDEPDPARTKGDAGGRPATSP